MNSIHFLLSLFNNKYKLECFKHEFGKDFVQNFLLFYFLKKRKDLICDYDISIPQGITEVISNLTLDFYEKVNHRCFITFCDQRFFTKYIKAIREVGIGVYNENDFYELGIISSLLADIIKKPNNHISF